MLHLVSQSVSQSVSQQMTMTAKNTEGKQKKYSEKTNFPINMTVQHQQLYQNN